MKAPSASTPSLRDLVVGTLAALATVAIWAAWPVVTRHGVGGTMGPAALSILRFVPPVVLLAPNLRRVGLFPKMRLRTMAGLFLGGVPFFIFAAEGFRFTSVANAIPVSVGSIALTAAAISVFILKVRIERIRLVGYALISLAIVLALVNALTQPGEWVALGVAFFALAGISFGVYSVAFASSGLSSLEAIAVISAWSLIVMLPFGLYDLISAVDQGLYGEIALQIVQQGLLSALAAILTYNIAVDRIGAPRAAAVLALAPVLATVTAYFTLGEIPSRLLVATLAVITVGVVLANSPGRQRTPS